MHTTALTEPVATHIERIRVDGFTVIEAAMDAALMNTIRDELQPYFQGAHMGRNNFEGERTERVYALLAKSPSLARLIEDERILAIVDAFLPKNYLLAAALAINVHPGETPQPWHIDDGAGGLGYPKPRPPSGISTIWAFDDFTEHNGATEVLPGSHRWPNDRVPRACEIHKVIMPAGSVLIFDGTVVHRGGANTSDGTRLAITPQYYAPALRQIENMVLAVPPHIAAQYSPRVQSLLGYNVIDPGFMGHVDGRHPKRLIDPDYRGRKYRDDLPDS